VLGAGVPAIVYDIGGSARSSGDSGRAQSSSRATQERCPRTLARLLHDPGELATARAGAERARDELTWEASAAAHLDLYRGLT
jgi:glycosyltransferase involved in cell wall biosynthesis